MEIVKFKERSGGMPGNAASVMMGNRMNVNNERHELCLSFVHVYKIAFRSKKVLTKYWKILYTAFK